MSGEVADWRERAACLGADPDVFFPENGGSYRRARAICSGCPVSDPCLEDALATEWGTSVAIRAGMFAGTKPSDRVVIEDARRLLNGEEVAA